MAIAMFYCDVNLVSLSYGKIPWIFAKFLTFRSCRDGATVIYYIV